MDRVSGLTVYVGESVRNCRRLLTAHVTSVFISQATLDSQPDAMLKSQRESLCWCLRSTRRTPELYRGIRSGTILLWELSRQFNYLMVRLLAQRAIDLWYKFYAVLFSFHSARVELSENAFELTLEAKWPCGCSPCFCNSIEMLTFFRLWCTYDALFSPIMYGIPRAESNSASYLHLKIGIATTQSDNLWIEWNLIRARF